MCSKQKRRFKSQCVQHDYANTRHISYINVNLMEQNIIQISGRKTNVDVSVKNIIHVKKMFGSLVHVFVKMQNI